MTSDQQLAQLRRSLGRFRRRVWLRRVVRHGSLILAAVVAVQLILAIVARLLPFEWHLAVAVAVAGVGAVVFIVDAIRIRPTIAEAALAVDREDGLRDRVSTALALADKPYDGTDEQRATYEHLVRLQREDALAAIATADPRGLRIPLPKRRTATALLCGLALVPALLLPNAQNDVIAQREQVREAAQRQATRLDESANRLDHGTDANDPRRDLVEELRRLARELRTNPDDLNRALANLGSLEDAIRSRLDPQNEQRAAAITSLARSLSRAASGSDSNPEGDPDKAKNDLDDLKERLPGMSQ